MVDAAFRTPPTQYAVPQDQLDSLRLTINAAVQAVKRLEDLHGNASGLFPPCPFIAQSFPALKDRRSCRVIRKSQSSRLLILFGLLQGFLDAGFIRGVIPASFDPRGNLWGRRRRNSQCRTLDP